MVDGLQWGRDSSVAEMGGIASFRIASNGLQWGRDSSVAEIGWLCGSGETRNCFNGAATLQSRKCRFRSSGRTTYSTLQWGRDSSVAEMTKQPTFWATKVQGFDGAATLQSRKSASSTKSRRWLVGFNGAATLQSRKSEMTSGYAGAVLRFNGAATLQSRKFLWLWIKRLKSASFNGAATLQSRKFPNRPCQRLSGASKLQWGRDSSVAEIRLGRPPCHAPSVLQWGRDSSVAEISRMLFGRQPMRWRFNGAATLQSRKLCFGSIPKLAAALLQWGRDSSVAEMRLDSGVDDPKPERLQWGRDSSVAEIRQTLRQFQGRIERFNGAATLQSRKCFHAKSTPSRNGRLQWGRDSSVAEIGTAGRVERGQGMASMGPRLFSRGNESKGVDRPLDTVGFNGAATLQSRKCERRRSARSRW